MLSTLNHAIAELRTFGIDIDPHDCDPAQLRKQARGALPSGAKMPRYATDLLETVARIVGEQRNAGWDPKP